MGLPTLWDRPHQLPSSASGPGTTPSTRASARRPRSKKTGSSSSSVREVIDEPRAREAGDLVEGARFLEQVRRAFYDLKALLAREAVEGLPVHLDDRGVVAPDDKQGRRHRYRRNGSRGQQPCRAQKLDSRADD